MAFNAVAPTTLQRAVRVCGMKTFCFVRPLMFVLILGVIALVYLAGRRPRGPASLDATAGTNRAALGTESSFKKRANGSPFKNPASDSVEPAPPVNTSNFFQRVASGELEVDLTSEQWAEYFRQHGTNVETLLGSQKRDNIRRAAELFPDDPRVQYAVVTRDIYPEARREWLDGFKASAPDNAMASYLSAREYLKAGDREQGLRELTEAAAKPHFNDYRAEVTQNREEAQLSAGRTVAEAKYAAMSGVLIPQLSMLKDVSANLVTMQKDYVGAGDTASAEALAQMARSLGQRLTTGEGSGYVINQYVGIAIEVRTLKELPLDSHPEYLGQSQSVSERLAELTAQKKSLQSLYPPVDEMLAQGHEGEIVSFFDRMKLQGEYKALL